MSREPKMICFAARSYGYEVATLDSEGQIIDSRSGDSPDGLPENLKSARQEAREWAEELGIPLRKKLVFQHQELMPTARELAEIT